MPSAGACSARTKPGSYSTNLSFTATTTRQPCNVWCQSRQSSSSGMCTTVHHQVLGDGVQEAVPVLLSKVLRKVLVCASWHVREQAVLPLLQQLEDQERRAQVPLKIRVCFYWTVSFQQLPNLSVIAIYVTSQKSLPFLSQTLLT